MSKIAFRYTESPLPDNTVFDPLAPSQKIVEALNFYENIETIGSTGQALNGNSYEHLFYTKTNYDIVLTADQITTNDITFFKNYWTAPNKYISIDDDDYIAVVTTMGELPIEYLEGVKLFPELTIKLIKKKAN